MAARHPREDTTGVLVQGVRVSCNAWEIRPDAALQVRSTGAQGLWTPEGDPHPMLGRRVPVQVQWSDDPMAVAPKSGRFARPLLSV
jgi:hypothetical protein